MENTEDSFVESWLVLLVIGCVLIWFLSVSLYEQFVFLLLLFGLYFVYELYGTKNKPKVTASAEEAGSYSIETDSSMKVELITKESQQHEPTKSTCTMAMPADPPSLLVLGAYVADSLSPGDLEKLQQREHQCLEQTLQEIKEHETWMYNMNCVFEDVHLFLKYMNCKKKHRLQMLDSESDSLIKMALKIAVLDAKGKTNEVDTQKTCAHKLCSKPEVMAQAEAEIAFYLSRLDHRLYKVSALILEKCLPNLPSEHLDFWKYELSRIYNKLLNKDFLFLLDHLDPFKVFVRIEELLLSLINPTSSLKYRASVDYADAFKKCKNLSQCKDLVMNSNYSIDRLMLYAYKPTSNAPTSDDPHVLERYGRFLRTKRGASSNPGVLKNAIAVLQKCVELCPCRHVAWHQLALAHKALWLLENKLNSRNSYRQKDHYSEIANEHRINSANGNGCVHISVDELKLLSAYNHSAEGMQNEHLHEAKECLEKATNCVNETVSAYLIDLARICVSLGDTEEAEDYFYSACLQDNETRTNRCDEATYYEQLGLFQLQHSDRDLDNIKELLRRAVERTDHTRSKPHSAYAMLKHVLKTQIDKATSESEKERMRKELFFIQICMSNFKDAKRTLHLIGGRDNVLEEVNLLLRQELHSEAFFRLYNSLCQGYIERSQCHDLLVELACLAAKDRSKVPGIDSIYVDVYATLYSRNGSPDSTKQLKSDGDCFSLKDTVLHHHFVLLVHNGNCKLARNLRTVLDRCGFTVYVISMDGYNDIDLGVNIIADLVQVIKHADIVIGYLPQISDLMKYRVDNTIASDASKLLLISHAEPYPEEWNAVPKVQFSDSLESMDTVSPQIFHNTMETVLKSVHALKKRKVFI